MDRPAPSKRMITRVRILPGASSPRVEQQRNPTSHARSLSLPSAEYGELSRQGREPPAKRAGPSRAWGSCPQLSATRVWHRRMHRSSRFAGISITCRGDGQQSPTHSPLQPRCIRPFATQTGQHDSSFGPGYRRRTLRPDPALAATWHPAKASPDCAPHPAPRRRLMCANDCDRRARVLMHRMRPGPADGSSCFSLLSGLRCSARPRAARRF
jgi:hypothetical protein